MCNLCVCVCVCVTLQRTNSAALDPFAATSSIKANCIESIRMKTTKSNRCKFTRVNGSIRNRKVNVTYCWRYIYVCMYVCLYLCLCVCNANNYELLRLYGCVVIGQTVCLAVPSVRMCVCLCACASGCCCASVCASVSVRQPVCAYQGKASEKFVAAVAGKHHQAAAPSAVCANCVCAGV